MVGGGGSVYSPVTDTLDLLKGRLERGPPSGYGLSRFMFCLLIIKRTSMCRSTTISGN